MVGIKAGVARELEAMGYQYVHDLQKLGWEKVCRLYGRQHSERVTYDTFISIFSGLAEIPARKLSEEQRQMVTQLVSKIKSEKEGAPGTPRTKLIRTKTSKR